MVFQLIEKIPPLQRKITKSLIDYRIMDNFIFTYTIIYETRIGKWDIYIELVLLPEKLNIFEIFSPGFIFSSKRISKERIITRKIQTRTVSINFQDVFTKNAIRGEALRYFH